MTMIGRFLPSRALGRGAAIDAGRTYVPEEAHGRPEALSRLLLIAGPRRRTSKPDVGLAAQVGCVIASFLPAMLFHRRATQ